VGQREVVLRIEPVFDQRVDVIDVELAAMEDKVDRIIANEAAAGLAGEELLLEPCPL